MSEESTGQMLSDQDRQAWEAAAAGLSQKLSTFLTELSDMEKFILEYMVSRAGSGADADTQGYFWWGNPPPPPTYIPRQPEVGGARFIGADGGSFRAR